MRVSQGASGESAGYVQDDAAGRGVVVETVAPAPRCVSPENIVRRNEAAAAVLVLR